MREDAPCPIPQHLSVYQTALAPPTGRRHRDHGGDTKRRARVWEDMSRLGTYFVGRRRWFKPGVGVMSSEETLSFGPFSGTLHVLRIVLQKHRLQPLQRRLGISDSTVHLLSYLGDIGTVPELYLVAIDVDLGVKLRSFRGQGSNFRIQKIRRIVELDLKKR
ncbi:hypothetical protein ARMGADRAFT_1025252 [Armillaria gallica]|uniref:Uncharacterized protein n=1 Tax=Armillaria gallica TaxID=47427 RepID=A0A2H3E5B1_ARMGA|nr:hypothetical protein ARMGADRAFT_1025252 [Armillaria gallica]